jgi:hypothetical protein
MVRIHPRNHRNHLGDIMDTKSTPHARAFAATLEVREAAAQAAMERVQEALTEVLYLSSDPDTLLKVDRAFIALGRVYHPRCPIEP